MFSKSLFFKGKVNPSFFLLFCFSVFFSADIFSQDRMALSVGDTLNDQGFAIVQTADSGYVVAGQTGSFGAGGGDMYVVKFNKSGKLIWTRTIGGPGNETGRSMVKTGDGGFVIAGQTSSFGAGNEDIYLVKLDNSGNLVWAYSYGGTGSEVGWEVINTSDGGFAVAGAVSNTSPAKGTDMYLLKVDKDGIYQWDRMIDGKSAGIANYTEIGYSVAQVQDGGLVLCGTNSTPVYFKTDIFLAKFDLNGNKIWVKSLVDPGNGKYNEYPRAIIATSDGGFLVGAEGALPCESGFVECNWDGINWHYYAAKFDSPGNLEWTKFIGSGTVSGVSADASDYLRSVLQTKDGGYILGGYSYGFRKDFATGVQKGLENFLVKIDNSGNLIWSKVIGTTRMDMCNAIIETNDGRYALAGYTSPSSGKGSDDLTLIVTDASGNSCLPTRTGGKVMGSGGTLEVFGTVGIGSAISKSGGTMSSGGLRSDLCALSLTIDYSAKNSCGDKCTGSISVSVSGGAAPYSYSWQPGGEITSGLTGLCPGSYTLSVTDNAGNKGSQIITVGKDNLPEAGFTYQQQSGYAVQFTDASKYATSWFWDFGKLNTQNSVTSIQQSPFISFPYDNLYPVKLVVSNLCGKDSITINVNVLKKTGIEETMESNQQIRISPNPANGNFLISGDRPIVQNMCLSIFNPMGQLVKREIIYPSGKLQKHCDISGLAPGLYKLILETGNQRESMGLMIE